MRARVTTPLSPVADLVCRGTVRIGSDATIAEAARAMRQANVSSVLVGQGLCIITERDVTEAVARDTSPSDRAGDVASHYPVVTEHSTSVMDAAGLMLNAEIRHLVVAMPDGQAAVVSLRDVIGALLQSVNPELWLTSLRVTLRPSPETWWG